MKTLILIIFTFTQISFFDANEVAILGNDSSGHIILQPLPVNNKCDQKYYSLSLHDSIQSKSAWFNSIKTYSFKLNDSTFDDFKSEFDFLIQEDGSIKLNCLGTKDNWYKIQNKTGKCYWTSVINYNFWCSTSMGQMENITFEKK